MEAPEENQNGANNRNLFKTSANGKGVPNLALNGFSDEKFKKKKNLD